MSNWYSGLSRDSKHFFNLLLRTLKLEVVVNPSFQDSANGQSPNVQTLKYKEDDLKNPIRKVFDKGFSTIDSFAFAPPTDLVKYGFSLQHAIHASVFASRADFPSEKDIYYMIQQAERPQDTSRGFMMTIQWANNYPLGSQLQLHTIMIVGESTDEIESFLQNIINCLMKVHYGSFFRITLPHSQNTQHESEYIVPDIERNVVYKFISCPPIGNILNDQQSISKIRKLLSTNGDKLNAILFVNSSTKTRLGVQEKYTFQVFFEIFALSGTTGAGQQKVDLLNRILVVIPSSSDDKPIYEIFTCKENKNIPESYKNLLNEQQKREKQAEQEKSPDQQSNGSNQQSNANQAHHKDYCFTLRSSCIMQPMNIVKYHEDKQKEGSQLLWSQDFSEPEIQNLMLGQKISRAARSEETTVKDTNLDTSPVINEVYWTTNQSRMSTLFSRIEEIRMQHHLQFFPKQDYQPQLLGLEIYQKALLQAVQNWDQSKKKPDQQLTFNPTLYKRISPIYYKGSDRLKPQNGGILYCENCKKVCHNGCQLMIKWNQYQNKEQNIQNFYAEDLKSRCQKFEGKEIIGQLNLKEKADLPKVKCQACLRNKLNLGENQEGNDNNENQPDNQKNFQNKKIEIDNCILKNHILLPQIDNIKKEFPVIELKLMTPAVNSGQNPLYLQKDQQKNTQLKQLLQRSIIDAQETINQNATKDIQSWAEFRKQKLKCRSSQITTHKHKWKADELGMEIISQLKKISQLNACMDPEKYIVARKDLLQEMKLNDALQNDFQYQYQMYEILFQRWIIWTKQALQKQENDLQGISNQRHMQEQQQNEHRKEEPVGMGQYYQSKSVVQEKLNQGLRSLFPTERKRLSAEMELQREQIQEDQQLQQYQNGQHPLTHSQISDQILLIPERSQFNY